MPHSAAAAVGTTIVLSGGTLAPGPISGTLGTMTVAGNLIFQSGAIYLAQVTPSAPDTISVSGTAKLAGTVRANFAPGTFIPRLYLNALREADSCARPAAGHLRLRAD
jgi:hypothetical protein